MTDYNAPDWVQDAIFYQIFPERFANGDKNNDPAWVSPWGIIPTPQTFCGGDLQGILDKLPYLSDLGINALYLTPVFSARSNHKYDTSDYFQVDPGFGDKTTLKLLVDAAHDQGIRVVLDTVYNHCGDGFWAFEDVVKNGAQSPYTDWFFINSFPIRNDPPNYQTCGGAGFLPKLNLANPKVRSHLLEATVYWMRFLNIDGWRLDVPWKAPNSFWQEFRQVIKQINPEAYIVAEAWRDGPFWLRGDTCDAIMNYPLRDYILDYCVRDNMDAEDFDIFSGRLREDYQKSTPFQLNLLGSHDTARILTLCSEDESRLHLALTCLYTMPGAPMLYYGDEIGMTGGNDPDCRRCMNWDETGWKVNILDAVKQLIQIRKDHPALRRGNHETLWTFNGVLVFRRVWEDDQVIVILNPRNQQTDLSIPIHSDRFSCWKDELSGKIFSVIENGIKLDVLPARQSMILIPLSL